MRRVAELVIVGDGEFAEIAYEYFTHDSPHEVVAFSAEREYLTKPELFGLPVVPFEELAERYDPARHGAFVAITYTQLNRVRARLYEGTKRKGYQLVSYVSSRAFVWRNVEIGENCFVFENNVLQYHVRLGNDVVLWSGNHIGHRTTIGDHCFVSSHVVISGHCRLGTSCFLGVNSCLGDEVAIGDDCVIGAGAVVVKDLEGGRVYVGNPARALDKSSFEAFGVPR
jgi:sugar O-acyltransferase (sialic acid O-acetyltransferase NeuD family)